MIKEILINFIELQQSNPWIAAATVFITQTIFLWARTLNVVAVSRLQVWKAVWTGVAIGLSWMIAIAIGVDALWTGTWQPILAHILGGVLGTWMTLRKEKRKQAQKDG